MTNDETTKTHVFNYHEEPEYSFLRWAMIHFGSNQDNWVGSMSDVTDNFTNIELGITVNGVAVDAKAFMDRLDQGVEWAVERGVKAAIVERLPGLDKLIDSVSDLEKQIQSHALRIAADAGYEISEGDRYW